MNNKIALFGLAANPPTLGHRYVVETLINSKLVDEIWINPVYKHFHNKSMESYQNRLEMCKFLFSDLSNKVKIVDYERQICENNLKYNGSTINFLLYLDNILKIDIKNLYIVIGQDNAESILTWNKGNELINQNKFIIIPRTNNSINNDVKKWYMKNPHHFLENIPNFNVSSTEVRNEIKNRNIKKLKELLSIDVLNYIFNNNLYKE